MNNSGLVKGTHTIPGISDHDMIVIDSVIKPVLNSEKNRLGRYSSTPRRIGTRRERMEAPLRKLSSPVIGKIKVWTKTGHCLRNRCLALFRIMCH